MPSQLAEEEQQEATRVQSPKSGTPLAMVEHFATNKKGSKKGQLEEKPLRLLQEQVEKIKIPGKEHVAIGLSFPREIGRICIYVESFDLDTINAAKLALKEADIQLESGVISYA